MGSLHSLSILTMNLLNTQLLKWVLTFFPLWNRDFFRPIECIPFHEIVCFKSVEKLQSVSTLRITLIYKSCMSFPVLHKGKYSNGVLITVTSNLTKIHEANHYSRIKQIWRNRICSGIRHFHILGFLWHALILMSYKELAFTYKGLGN